MVELVVVDRAGQRQRVVGWAACLVGLVCAHAEALNAAPFGRAVFDFSPTAGMALRLDHELGKVGIGG